MDPAPLVLEGRNPNHWNTRKVPLVTLLNRGFGDQNVSSLPFSGQVVPASRVCELTLLQRDYPSVSISDKIYNSRYATTLTTSLTQPSQPSDSGWLAFGQHRLEIRGDKKGIEGRGDKQGNQGLGRGQSWTQQDKSVFGRLGLTSAIPGEFHPWGNGVNIHFHATLAKHS